MVHVLNIMTYLESKRIWEFPYLDRQAALSYAYKKEFGMIREEGLSATEFGLITMSDKTNALFEFNPRARRIRLFKQLEVTKHFGLSLVEFLSMTRSDVDMILEELQYDVILAAKSVAANERDEARKQKEHMRKAEEAGKNRWPGS